MNILNYRPDHRSILWDHRLPPRESQTFLVYKETHLLSAIDIHSSTLTLLLISEDLSLVS